MLTNVTNPSVAGSPKIDDHGYGVAGCGANYCSVNANSTGAPAILRALECPSLSGADMTLISSPIPNQFSVFFHGANQSEIPFGNGFLCTTGDIRRSPLIPPSGSGATYTFDNDVDFAAFVGQTRYFQHWYRDPAGGGAAFNTSDALAIDITP